MSSSSPDILVGDGAEISPDILVGNPGGALQALISPEEEFIEVVYNDSYGGFGLSEKAQKLYYELACETCTTEEEKKEALRLSKYDFYLERHDPILINVFKQLGEECNGKHAKLKIIELPKDYVKYYRISEYDGKECVTVDKNKYLIGKTKKVIEDENKTSDEKVDAIREILRNFNENHYW